MTLQEAISEVHALYPDRYVSVDLSANWHTHDAAPTVAVNIYVADLGHLVWGAKSIDAAVRELHAKHAGTDAADLQTGDAELAQMTEVRP